MSHANKEPKTLTQNSRGEFTEVPYTVVYMSSEDKDAIRQMKLNGMEYLNGTGWISAQ